MPIDDKKKTKTELLKEVSKLRRQIKKLQNAKNQSKQIENELFQSKEMLRLILDTIPQRVFWKDINLNYMGCNEKFAEDAKLDSSFKIVGKNDFELALKKLSKLYEEDERKIIESNISKLNFEEFITQSDGNKAWFKTSKVPLHDRYGKVIGILGTYDDITKQKQIEEKLEQEKILLRTLINNIPDGIYVKDIECRKTLSNKADLRNMGKTSENQVLGKTDFELFSKEIAEKFYEDDIAVIQNGKPVLNRKEFFIDRLGKKSWLLTSKMPLRDADGNIIGLIGIGRNINEQKLFEEALQNQHNFLRTLIDNVPDLIYFKDNQARYVLNNKAHLSSLGVENQDDVIGKTTFDFNPYELAENYYKDEINIIRTGDPMMDKEEIAVNKKTNQKVWHLTSKIPLWKDGKVIGIVCISRDITEKKRAEEILQNERNQLRILIDSLPNLIFFKDVEGKYLLNNKAHLEFLGFKDQSEVFGKTIFDFHENGQAGEFFEEEQQVLKTGKSFLEVEQLIFHKTKNENRWFLVSRIPLKNKNGEIKGILGVGHDITNRKQAETDLCQTYDELKQTNKELIEANKVKSQFLANMSHEIRTPLNAVIGMTGLLLDTPLNDEQRDFAETIFSSGDILLSLINDILDFSKIEAQKIELEKQPFDVRNCVEEALDLVASKAANKNIELLYLLDEGLPTNVIGDVTRLRQIMVNLLGNAIKFTEEGEVVVGVSGQLKDNNNYMLHFSVRDTGLGIPLERQNQLFQSFTQVDSSTTRKFGGTGLGLAISKQLSELMGGTMWLESAGIPGEGTTFHFTITAELSVENEVRTDLSALAGKRILIVDDNKTNRNILKQQTSSLLMKPEVVASGAEALEILRNNNEFDLAIIDYQMPEIDGIMLAEEIRKIPERKSLPLILLSSYGYHNNKNMNLTYFAATLTKPIKFSHLHNALLTILKKNKGSVKMQRDISALKFDSDIGKHYPLKILLAEDNKVNQKVALRFLEKIGYCADVAFNGIEVLDSLRRQFYDVILMDIQMPEMDGEQATIEIRKSFLPNQQPRIIAMTANALKSDREKYISSGMDDYIVKPFKMEELLKALVESYSFFHPLKTNLEETDSKFVNKK